MRKRTFAVAAGLLAAVGAVPSGAAPVPKDKLPPPTAKELATSAGNLKRIVVAAHNCEAANLGFLPNNLYAKDGTPLLSWRVALTPYLDDGQDRTHADLYFQFKLTEPWDSEHNSKLIARMPRVFAPVRVTAKPGETFYRGFAGKGAVFGPDSGRGLTIAAIADGTSNTGMVFEAADPVVWTKPDDLPFDPKRPLPKLGGLFDGRFHVAFVDGSVRLAKVDPDPTHLRALIGYNDGEVSDTGVLFEK